MARITTLVDTGLYQYETKAGAVRFMAAIKHHERYTRKFGFPTISKARQWRQSRIGCIADDRLFPEIKAQRDEIERQADMARQTEIERQQRPTISSYGDIFIKAKEGSGLKFTTIRRYQSILDTHLKPVWGMIPLADIDRAKVRELVAALNDKGLKPKSIKNVLLCISSLYSDAIEDGHVQHNPALRPSKLIKTAKRSEDVVAFTYEEECRVLQTAKDKCPHYFPFILLLFRTGLREGEAVALRPEDLDLQIRQLWVQRNFTAGRMSDTPKSRQKRQVDLSRDLADCLRDCLTIREAEAMLGDTQPSEWLFTTPGGEMIRSNNFRERVWKPLLKAAGLPYRWIHSTRHTYASRLIMSQANIVYVQNQLGHSSIKTTVDNYVHWMKESKRDSVLEVDRLIGQNLGAGCTPGCTPEAVNMGTIDNKGEIVG